MPVWLLMLAAAGLFVAARRPAGGSATGGYRQTVSLGGAAPAAPAGFDVWRMGNDGVPFDVSKLPTGATYYYPCLPGDMLFQDVWCARGGTISYGVAKSGSVGKRAFGLVWGAGGELGKRAATIGQTFTENAEPVTAAIALIAANAAKAAKLAKKYGPTGLSLVDTIDKYLLISDEAAEDSALADL
jgi:hypothetical protein